MIVVVYVYDLIIIGNNPNLILRLKGQLVDSFEMTDLGILDLFPRLQVLPLHDGVFIFVSKYALDMLIHFKMDDCKSCATPFKSGVKLTKEYHSSEVDTTIYQQLVGSLIYLNHSRPDISFVVSVVSQFMQDPWESHQKVVKRIVH